MKDFGGKLAVVTGGGSGIGRELALQLARVACDVAICDVLPDTLEQTRADCERIAPAGTRVSTHVCDVSREVEVLAFRDAVQRAHATDHVELLFNNAGIGAAGSFLNDDRAEWDRTFGVCWSGVYFCSRAFMPLLVASSEACIVNTSSVNGFWACMGPQQPQSAYSAAKFAVKGFTEALIVDLRLHAPHVQAFLVMPGHIGTPIIFNSRRVLGKPPPAEMNSDELAVVRRRLADQGRPVDGVDDAQLRAGIEQSMVAFRDQAPLSAERAAAMILDGVRAGTWRILVGEDAKFLDRKVRESPDEIYDVGFLGRAAGPAPSDKT